MDFVLVMTLTEVFKFPPDGVKASHSVDMPQDNHKINGLWQQYQVVGGFLLFMI